MSSSLIFKAHCPHCGNYHEVAFPRRLCPSCGHRIDLAVQYCDCRRCNDRREAFARPVAEVLLEDLIDSSERAAENHVAGEGDAM